MKLLLTISIILTSYYVLLSQSNYNYTISGYIKDSSSGESIINANLISVDQQIGTTSNNFGFFTLTLPQGEQTLIASYVGYDSDTLKVNLRQDMIISIFLFPSSELATIEISTQRYINSDKISTLTLSPQVLKAIPTLGGESDIIKAIQLLPGVKFGEEGTAGFYVRGGGPDQNLVLLDGIPIYNPTHLFGFVSTFNADAIQTVDLIKGGFPARYGGRLSSVLDVRTKDGNNQSFQGQGTLGIVASKLLVEGPIKKDKSSFLVSARRSFYELFLFPISKLSVGDTDNAFNFHDINAKLNYSLSSKDKLFIGFYNGRDYLSIEDNMEQSNISQKRTDSFLNTVKWGNQLAYVRWNRMYAKNLFGNATVFSNRYFFNTESISKTILTDSVEEILNQEIKSIYNSNIDDLGFKLDFHYTSNYKHNIKFGGEIVSHRFKPGALTSFNLSDTLTSATPTIKAIEPRIYIEDNFKINHWLTVNMGLHGSSFVLQENSYYSLEPRLSTQINLINNLRIELSYTQMKQYLHLLTNSSIGLPTDLWVPPTQRIPPQSSEQLSLGISYLFENKYQFSIDSYYKKMQGLINYKEGASFLIEGKDWEDKVVIDGEGLAYGVEFFAQKMTGKTTGWLGYTLAYVDRQFDELNSGNPFPYKYDRRHDFSVVINHQLKKNIKLNANWVFATGNAITIPNVIYPNINYPPDINKFNNFASSDNSNLINITAGVPGSYRPRQLEEIFDYDGVNGDRVPVYHRLDLGISFFKKKKWIERTININLYNAYSKHNTYYIRYAFDGGSLKNPFTAFGRFESIALIPIIPSISYDFKF